MQVLNDKNLILKFVCAIFIEFIRRTRTPARAMLPPKTPKSRQASKENLVKDPVQVFCRLRPLQSEADLSCIRVVSSTTIALIPPESAINYKIIGNKETQYVFKHIFDVDSTQHECFTTVAQPLVEGLIKGRNGLLFSYGVTGSGKTFTMTGEKFFVRKGINLINII